MPAAFSPRTASPAGSPATGTRTPKADLSRARSVRTERRREKFAKVLRGRVEEGSIEQSEFRVDDTACTLLYGCLKV